MEDIALAVTVVTPEGIIETKPYPAASIGPDIFKFFLENTLNALDIFYYNQKVNQ